MRHISESRLIDTALLGFLIGAWVTHEAGALVHSLVSIGFTIAAALHVRHNWKAYRSAFHKRERRVIPDLTVGVSMAIVTVSGFTLWLASQPLGHEVVAIVGTVALLPHFWVHRSSIRRVLGRTVERTAG